MAEEITNCPRILIVEGERDAREGYQALVRMWDCEVLAVDSGEKALAQFPDFAPSVILADIELPGMNGLDLLGHLGDEILRIPFIIITEHGNDERVVQAIEAGAFWYIEKPLNPPILRALLDRAVGRVRDQTYVAAAASVSLEHQAMRGSSYPRSEFGRKQKVCIGAALLLIVLATLFPPWKSRWGSSYGFLFSPPNGFATVDLTRLYVEWLLIIFVVGGVLLAVKEWRRETTENNLGTPPRTAQKKPRWLLILGASIVLGLALVTATMLWAIYSYKHRSMPPIEWSPVEIKSCGLNAFLKTEVRDGNILYQFRVTPNSPKLSVAFNVAVGVASTSKQFGLTFYDINGFLLCGQSVDTSREINAVGAVEALIDNGKIYSCSSDDYKRASRWNVSYSFPPLSIVQDELD